MKKIVEIKNVEKYYGNKGNITKALDRISFSIYEKEYVAIMGASYGSQWEWKNDIVELYFYD